MSTSILFKSSLMNLGSAAVNLLKADCLGKTTGQEARYLRSVRIAERETQHALTNSDTAKEHVANDSPFNLERPVVWPDKGVGRLFAHLVSRLSLFQGIEIAT
jgi:hypothetical protein